MPHVKFVSFLLHLDTQMLNVAVTVVVVIVALVFAIAVAAAVLCRKARRYVCLMTPRNKLKSL